MSRRILVALTFGLLSTVCAGRGSGQTPSEDLLEGPVADAPEGSAASDSWVETPTETVYAPAPCPPSTTCYEPGAGITISMLNGESSLNLFGSFSTIVAGATTRTFPTGGPLFLLPPSAVNPTNTFDIGARQSSFGAMFSGPEMGGLKPGAFFLAYIQNDNLTSDAYGFLPYNAYGELENDNWRFAAGLQPDVFNPVSQNMIALIGLFASGNTGSFRGQVRAERFVHLSEGVQLTGQLAASEPISTIVTDNRRIVEDNGWPNVEARTALGLGAVQELVGGRKRRPFELGVSGVIGQLRNATLQAIDDVPPGLIRSVIEVWGVGLDAQIAFTDRLGFAGEVFDGQSLGEYNGMITQTFNSDTLGPIRGAGGWGELYYYLSDRVHLHSGYGVDAPVRRDLADDQIAHNQTYFANVFWDVTKTVQLSFQVEHRETDFVTFRDAHGQVYMSQFLFRF